jgi:hypothetical protein
MERLWWGKDNSARCASPFGSLPAATLSRCARIEPWSKLLILPAWAEYAVQKFDSKEVISGKMVVGEGFEPSKSMTADLQSAPFGRSGTPPGVIHILR